MFTLKVLMLFLAAEAVFGSDEDSSSAVGSDGTGAADSGDAPEVRTSPPFVTPGAGPAWKCRCSWKSYLPKCMGGGCPRDCDCPVHHSIFGDILADPVAFSSSSSASFDENDTWRHKALKYAKTVQKFVAKHPVAVAGGVLALGTAAALPYYLSKTDEPLIEEPHNNGTAGNDDDCSAGGCSTPGLLDSTGSKLLGLTALAAGAYGIYKYFFSSPKAKQQPEESESPAKGTKVAQRPKVQRKVSSYSATPAVSRNANTAPTSQKAKDGKKRQ